MIVRIATEGQYELADDLHRELNELDDATVEAVQAGDEERFASSFERLLTFVRERGARLGPDDLRESEIILPPPDLSLSEAEGEFAGEGLVPDLPH